jgi:hypothetical protein
MLFNEAIDHQGHFGTDYTAQDSVKHAHGVTRNCKVV